MKKSKMCPILQAGHQNYDPDAKDEDYWKCQGGLCQWWVGGDCAIVLIAQKTGYRR